MQPNEHLRRIMKTLIFAFLCAEMQTTFTHCDPMKQRGIGASTAAGNHHQRVSRAPYQASIRLAEQELDYFGKGHICSGALVGPSVVLTVGHCLFNNESNRFYHPAELRVVLGSSRRFAPAANGQIYGVTHIYQPAKQLTLAVLMLEQDVPADQPLIQPISLPRDSSMHDSEVEHVTSWGRILEDGEELHEMLSLPAKRLHCDEPHQICALYGNDINHLPYALDVGAPLAKGNQLIGLHSNSTSAVTSANIASFVKIESHVDWIQAQTGDGSNQNSSIWGILGLIIFTAYVIRCSRKSSSY